MIYWVCSDDDTNIQNINKYFSNIGYQLTDVIISNKAVCAWHNPYVFISIVLQPLVEATIKQIINLKIN